MRVARVSPSGSPSPSILPSTASNLFRREERRACSVLSSAVRRADGVLSSPLVSSSATDRRTARPCASATFSSFLSCVPVYQSDGPYPFRVLGSIVGLVSLHHLFRVR